MAVSSEALQSSEAVYPEPARCESLSWESRHRPSHHIAHNEEVHHASVDVESARQIAHNERVWMCREKTGAAAVRRYIAQRSTRWQRTAKLKRAKPGQALGPEGGV